MRPLRARCAISVGAGETRTRFWNASNAPACSCAVSTRNLAGSNITRYFLRFSPISSTFIRPISRSRCTARRTLAHGKWSFRRRGASRPGVQKLHVGPLMRSTFGLRPSRRSAPDDRGALVRVFAVRKRSPAAPILRSNAPMRWYFCAADSWLNRCWIVSPDLPDTDRSRPRPIPT